MRISEIQSRRNLPPEDQRVPARRAIAWTLFAAVIVVGIVLFFRHARVIAPLLGPNALP